MYIIIISLHYIIVISYYIKLDIYEIKKSFLVK